MLLKLLFFSFLFQTEWVFCFSFYVICQKIVFFSKFHFGPEDVILTFSGFRFFLLSLVEADV